MGYLDNNGVTRLWSKITKLYDKVISRGEQLIVNGNGIMGDNTNFSSWIYDGAVANNSPGSFTKPSGGKYTLSTDEYFPVNPSNKYKLSLDCKSQNGLARMYTFLQFYDADKNSIGARNHMYNAGSTTTLARELKKGDTVIYLTDASGWSTSYAYGFYMAVWNWTNKAGYTYPPETYSRRSITLPKTSANKLDSACINYTANTITLASAYTGDTIPAGTSVSQGGDGGTYKYNGMSNTAAPTTWTTYTGVTSGVDYSGKNASGMFPPGTAYARFGILWNNSSNADQAWITNVSVTDIGSDTNTTYQLTKSGSNIILTGSDGSATSVADSNTHPTIDSALNSTSTNPVQNKVINAALGNKANASDLTGHTGNTSNPHGVTKAQVGLGNVENKSAATILAGLTSSNVTTALGFTPANSTDLSDKLSKSSNNTLNANVTIKLNTYGTRFITLSGNSIDADMSNETGGWAGNFASVKDPSGTVTTMLGWYGSASGLTHIFMGGTYNDPALKMTGAGEFTFKTTPKVGTVDVALSNHNHDSAYDAKGSASSAKSGAITTMTNYLESYYLSAAQIQSDYMLLSTAQANYAKKTDITDLKVGGRNLLKPTTTKGGNTAAGSNYNVTITTNNSDTYFYIHTYEPLVEGEEYTFSYEVTGLVNDEYYEFLINNNASIGKARSVIGKRVSCTFTAPSTLNGVSQILIDDSTRKVNSVKTASVVNLKLEKGNKATEWTPAPEAMATKADLSGYALSGHTHSDYAASNHTHDYLPLSGGTLTGNLVGKYITGTWLQTTATTNLGSACSKIAVLDSSGWVYFRTPAEILSDIGAAASHSHSYLPLSGGTLTGELLINTGTTQSATKGIKWSPINSKNPYIGYATDQVDGTFVLASLIGTNYASGLAIGGGSGNLLWKGTKVATVTDLAGYSTTSHSHTLDSLGVKDYVVERGTSNGWTYEKWNSGKMTAEIDKEYASIVFNTSAYSYWYRPASALSVTFPAGLTAAPVFDVIRVSYMNSWSMTNIYAPDITASSANFWPWVAAGGSVTRTIKVRMKITGKWK